MKTTGGSSLLRGHPYRNIFVAMLAVILGQALAPHVLGVFSVGDLAIAGLIIAALVETVRERRNAVVALLLGLPAVASRIVAAFRPDSPVENGAVLALNTLFIGFLIWNILSDVARSRRPTTERIFGALCAYVFLGILFALLYAHLEFRDPAASAFSVSNDAVIESVGGESGLLPLFTYYSFVTLTTLGYGDITPVSEAARTLAWLEALLGQLYLAVMVAGLVAAHMKDGGDDDRTRQPDPSGN
jgi:hypothetical protein